MEKQAPTEEKPEECGSWKFGLGRRWGWKLERGRFIKMVDSKSREDKRVHGQVNPSSTLAVDESRTWGQGEICRFLL